MRSYDFVVERDPETNLLVGYVPGWPGAHSQGADIDELQQNLREVIEMLLEDGEPALEASRPADVVATRQADHADSDEPAVKFADVWTTRDYIAAGFVLAGILLVTLGEGFGVVWLTTAGAIVALVGAAVLIVWRVVGGSGGGRDRPDGV